MYVLLPPKRVFNLFLQYREVLLQDFRFRSRFGISHLVS
jgi:hypothetical protein